MTKKKWIADPWLYEPAIIIWNLIKANFLNYFPNIEYTRFLSTGFLGTRDQEYQPGANCGEIRKRKKWTIASARRRKEENWRFTI